MTLIDKNLRQVQYDNGETLQRAVCPASPSVTYATGSVSASTDPFSGKTNKFAESKTVRVIASAAGHVKFGSSAPTATTSDYYLAANIEHFFVIAKGLEFMAVIPFTGSASFWITELY
jgi:hypothetical protein